MAKIIFEYTKCGKYASQGGSPSGIEGYNIWIEYPDDDMLSFLGFSTTFDFNDNVAYYQSNGDMVYIKEKNAN